MPKFKVKHITRYSYATPVIDCANQVMLYPLTDELQEVEKHDLTITHHPAVEVFTDYFGNRVGVFSIIEPHNELVIESVAHVVTHPIEYPTDQQPARDQWEQLKAMDEQFPYMDFLATETFESTAELQMTVNGLSDYSLTPLENAVLLANFVYQNFEYRKGVTSVETKLDEIWKLKAGVCQDFAHMLLVLLRIIGIPARYVSGYICPKGSEQRGEGATHAWVEAFIPSFGWIGLDPTNNVIVSDCHIRLAVGRNFSDCTPVKGTYKGSSEHSLEVLVTIENGKFKSNTDKSLLQPVFNYHVKNPAEPSNSYRLFMEMQQQQ
jgi:transglutaminase-like putative cysteine protease